MYEKSREAPELHNIKRGMNRCYYMYNFIVAGASTV